MIESQQRHHHHTTPLSHGRIVSLTMLVAVSATLALAASVFVASALSASTPPTWTIETLDFDSGDAAMVIDDAGVAHVSYHHWPTRSLHYAKRVGGAWQITVVDTVGVTGERSSIDLDSAGHPHISYLDRTNRILKYAFYDGSAWSIEVVDNSGFIDPGTGGVESSLAIDGADVPHIAYTEPGDIELPWGLKYASRSSGPWSTEYVTYGWDRWASIDVDESNQPHISFSNDDRRLGYATLVGGTWATTVADPTDGRGTWFTSIAVDSSGRPHIGYRENVPHTLKHAVLDGGSWVTEVIAGGGSTSFRDISLAVDDADNPHLGYMLQGQSVEYTWHDGAAWATSTVDPRANGGTTLALDAAGNPHIAYVGGDDAGSVGDDLLYAFAEVAEPDADGDGVPDAEDNCPAIPNPDQDDFDEDGLGDLCDDATDMALVKAELISTLTEMTDEATLAEARAIELALGRIERSLDPTHWTSTSQLDPRNGHRAFVFESQAAGVLQNRIVNRDSVLADEVDAVIAVLVEGDRRLAVEVIAGAEDADGNPHRIDRAWRQIARGDADRDASRPGPAIRHYASAWRHAVRAL